MNLWDWKYALFKLNLPTEIIYFCCQLNFDQFLAKKKLFWTIAILLFNFIQTVVVCKHKLQKTVINFAWLTNFSLSVPWIYRVVEVDLTRDAVIGFLKHFRAIQAKLNNLTVPEGYKMSMHVLHYKLRACKFFFCC